jgi:DedD protein
MDRSLKERLIGAAVLVLLAVLVVPELLSGRKATTALVADEPAGRELRTYTIELGGTSALATPAADGSMSRPSGPAATPLAVERPSPPPAGPPAMRPQLAPDTPPPAAKAVAPPTSTPPKSTPPKSTAEEPTSAPAPREATPDNAPMSAPARGTWSVQVGAFGSAESARKLVRDLEADGYRAYVSPLQRNGKTLHRVRVGPEPAKAAADALSGRLKSRGLPVSLVAND